MWCISSSRIGYTSGKQPCLLVTLLSACWFWIDENWIRLVWDLSFPICGIFVLVCDPVPEYMSNPEVSYGNSVILHRECLCNQIACSSVSWKLFLYFEPQIRVISSVIKSPGRISWPEVIACFLLCACMYVTTYLYTTEREFYVRAALSRNLFFLSYSLKFPFILFIQYFFSFSFSHLSTTLLLQSISSHLFCLFSFSGSCYAL